MPRIRTIKPSFWTDRRIATGLTRDQRLFYIGLWNQADDEGRFLASPRHLLGAIFPHDEDIHGAFIEDSLRTLGALKRIVLYRVDGEEYGQIVKWHEHQRINRPTKSSIPSHDNDLAVIHGALTEPSRSPPLRNKEGEGEEGSGGGSGSGITPLAVIDGNGPSPSLRSGAEWQSEEVGIWNGGAVVAAYVRYRQSRGWPEMPSAEIGKQGAAGSRIGKKHSPRAIVVAMLGMDQVAPHSMGQPWDLFDLERKFVNASTAASQNPDVRWARARTAFLEEA